MTREERAIKLDNMFENFNQTADDMINNSVVGESKKTLTKMYNIIESLYNLCLENRNYRNSITILGELLEIITLTKDGLDISTLKETTARIDNLKSLYPKIRSIIETDILTMRHKPDPAAHIHVVTSIYAVLTTADTVFENIAQPNPKQTIGNYLPITEREILQKQHRQAEQIIFNPVYKYI